MFKIELSDIDELYEVSMELGMITYLQGLVEFDSVGKSIYEQELGFVQRCVVSYLFEKQLESVTKLRQLLEKDRLFIKEES